MDDFDDLLLGSNALDQLSASGLFVDLRHELLDNVIMDVRLKERGTNLAQTLLHVRFGQNTTDTKTPKGGRESFLQVVEHQSSKPRRPIPEEEPVIIMRVTFGSNVL